MNGPLNQRLPVMNSTIQLTSPCIYYMKREKKTNMDWVPVSIIDYNCCGEIHLNKYF